MATKTKTKKATKAKARTTTLTDPVVLDREISRMADKWGWREGEFRQYLLRMGANRCLALERYGKAVAAR